MRLKAICEIIEQFSDVCNILKADDIKEEFYYLYYREGDCGQGVALKTMVNKLYAYPELKDMVLRL